MSRTEYLSDEQWDRIAPCLPKLTSRGRPWADNRACLEGILWVLRTGARWQDLPERYPSASTCWRRLNRWMEEDVWLGVWRAFLSELDEQGRLDWREAFVDGTFVPAKKGALVWEKPSGAKVRRSWQWQTALVFLSPYPLEVLRRMK